MFLATLFLPKAPLQYRDRLLILTLYDSSFLYLLQIQNISSLPDFPKKSPSLIFRVGPFDHKTQTTPLFCLGLLAYCI